MNGRECSRKRRRRAISAAVRQHQLDELVERPPPWTSVTQVKTKQSGVIPFRKTLALLSNFWRPRHRTVTDDLRTTSGRGTENTAETRSTGEWPRCESPVSAAQQTRPTRWPNPTYWSHSRSEVREVERPRTRLEQGVGRNSERRRCSSMAVEFVEDIELVARRRREVCRCQRQSMAESSCTSTVSSRRHTVDSGSQLSRLVRQQTPP